MTTSLGCVTPSNCQVIALVSQGVAAANPPLNPAPHSHVADTTAGKTLVMIVESPTYTTRASGWRTASASFAAGIWGFETARCEAKNPERNMASSIARRTTRHVASGTPMEPAWLRNIDHGLRSDVSAACALGSRGRIAGQVPSTDRALSISYSSRSLAAGCGPQPFSRPGIERVLKRD